VLSLDFRGDDFIGPPALLQRPHLWPARVIVMTLARVGADGGPDLARIAQIANLAPQAQVYAAGGIRDIADLRAARAAGAHGALIASALHAQKIKADDLEEITGL
jgi:phosphoribosylformimino-5-aminoimidazole carboxamide ribonucleotide (ProFAR) isomerase